MRLSGSGVVTQEASAIAAIAHASDHDRCNGATVEWIILEALVALALGLAIVWWTLSPARRREREQEKRDADRGKRDDVRNGDGDSEG